MTKKTFNLGNLKASYKVPKLTYVALEELAMANELRLLFEICLSIGLTLVGVVIPKFDLSLFITSIIFLLASGIFGVRYLVRYKKMKVQL